MAGTTIQRAMLARIKPNGGNAALEPGDDKRVIVMFNPETLRITRSVTVQADTRSGGVSSQAAQQVTTSSAKLAVDLVFDTTADFDAQQDEADVTKITRRIVELFVTPPAPDSTGAPAAASACLFLWGTFQFTGMVESYNETLEFFSASGVPLRSAVSLSLAENRYKLQGVPQRVPGRAQPLPAGAPIGPALSTVGLDPRGWRATALANGLETPRFSAGASLDLDAGAGFSARAGASIGLGFSVGASADLGTSIAGAFDADAGASASVGFT